MRVCYCGTKHLQNGPGPIEPKKALHFRFLFFLCKIGKLFYMNQ